HSGEPRQRRFEWTQRPWPSPEYPAGPRHRSERAAQPRTVDARRRHATAEGLRPSGLRPRAWSAVSLTQWMPSTLTLIARRSAMAASAADLDGEPVNPIELEAEEYRRKCSQCAAPLWTQIR